MPGILPMKVIKVGANAQTRIAQAWYSRSASRILAGLLTDYTVTVVGPKRFAVMAFARKEDSIRMLTLSDANLTLGAARNVSTLASNARRATSSVAEPFLADTPSLWKKECDVWRPRSET